MGRVRGILALIAIGCAGVAVARADEEPLGATAAEWEVADWLNSPPLTLEGLRGRVVLVRWWTAPGCSLCAATAPSLNQFHSEYADRGLTVIGFYHHKSLEPLELSEVRRAADEFGFRFPVAVDHDWATLRRWWLTDSKRRFTSVSFLIDREGVIRHIHPGGQYAPGEPAFEEMKAKIEELLVASGDAEPDSSETTSP